MEYHGNPASLAFATAAEMSRLIHAKKISSVELTKMYLKRLDTIGRRLNAVVTLTDTPGRCGRPSACDRGAGAGPFARSSSRDPVRREGPARHRRHPDDVGGQAAGEPGLRLRRDGGQEARGRRRGALRPSSHWASWRWAMSGSADRPSAPGTRAKAAAAPAPARRRRWRRGCVAFAIGSETMGSIISRPPFTNGVVGLRPTYGRVSRYGAMPLAPTMDKLGPMTRSAEDAAMVLSAIHGPDDLDLTAVAGIPFRWDAKSDLSKLKIGYDVAAFAEMAKTRSAQKRRDLRAGALDAARVHGGDGSDSPPDPKPYAGVAGLIIAARKRRVVRRAASKRRRAKTRATGPARLAQRVPLRFPHPRRRLFAGHAAPNATDARIP